MLPNVTSALRIPRRKRACPFVVAAFFAGLCLVVGFPVMAQAGVQSPASSTPQKAPSPEVKALLDKAGSATDTHEKMKLWQQAVVLAHQQGDGRSEVQALNSIGYEYDNTGRPLDALSAFRQELAAARSMGDQSVEAETQNGIGWIAYKCDRYEEARDAFQQSRSLFHAVSNPQKEVGALFGLGLLDTDAGWLSEAMSAQHEALAIALDRHDSNSEANALSGIGNVYVNMGRPVDALDSFQHALPLFQATKDRPGEAWMRFGMGRAAIEEGQPDEALASFRVALTIFSDMHYDSGRAQALNYIGTVESNRGHLPDALTVLQQARQVCHPDDRHVKADILYSCGTVYMRLGRPVEAMQDYRQALDIWHTAGDRTHEAILRAAIADVERRQGQREAAEDYARSVRLVEQVRTSMGGYDSTKQSYLTSTRYIYSDYLDFVLTLDGNRLPADASAAISTAFTLAQQTKGRSLLDFLQSGEVDLSHVLTAHESTQVRDLRSKSDALNAQLVKEGIENNPGAKKRYAAIQEEQRHVESDLQKLNDALYARHPDLAAKRGAKVATLADLTPLLDADTALLEYVQTTPDKVALFVVTKSDGEDANFPQVVTQYLTIPASLAACATFHSVCADPRKNYKPLAASLYQTLIAPVAGALEGKKRLIICPDGPLWNVPFQALTLSDSDDTSFLAERFEIDYAYSATGALAAHNERQRQRGQPPQPIGRENKDSLLVIANPSFGDARRFGDLDDLPGQRPIDKPSRPIDSPSRPLDPPSRPIDSPSRPLDKPSRAMAATLERAGGRIAALPGTQREADALQTLFPGATVLTGDAAQEGAVKQDAPRFRYLHFATHGFVNDGAPMLSSLVLAQPDAAARAAGDDGFLTARELFDLRLPNTEMVTLSACNTGRGDIQSGEGIVGMTWALFAAGCPTEVVSQWSVDDACTATLMERFYAGLKAGKPKGEALHDAAQATANDSSNAAHRHPYYWAPFVLFGEWK